MIQEVDAVESFTPTRCARLDSDSIDAAVAIHGQYLHRPRKTRQQTLRWFADTLCDSKVRPFDEKLFGACVYTSPQFGRMRIKADRGHGLV